MEEIGVGKGIHLQLYVTGLLLAILAGAVRVCVGL